MLKYVLILLFALAGCDSSPVQPNPGHQEDSAEEDPIDEDPAEEGLIVDFQLTDEIGNPTTEFLFGEDIFFKIKVNNQTGEDQPWSDAYYDVPFGFCVVAIGTEPAITMGSTLDGCLCSCEPDSGVLEQGATVTHDARWFDYPGHIVLPAGDYVACAAFNMRFKNISSDIEPIAFTVMPSKPDDEHVFSVFRMPAMGFYPPQGRFLWAHVVRSECLGVDRYILVGDRVIEMGLGVPGCPPERPCPITVPITPLILDEAQAQTLQRLIAEFPTVDPEINHACDPSYMTLYRLGSMIRRVGPCVYGPPEYREHMNDLGQFIESLVPHEAAREELARFPSSVSSQ